MADQEILQQFVAVAGCSPEEALHYLEACAGNIDAALELYLQTSTGAASSSSPTINSGAASGASGTSTQNGDMDEDEDVRAPIPKRQGVLVQESYRNSYAVPRRGRRPVTSSVFERNRDFREEGDQQYRRLAGSANDFQEAVKKRNTLATLFQPPRDIIHQGDWDSARASAREGGQWLLVNMQREQEFACQALNRDVWSNAAVKEVVKNNFIFWQIYDNEPEGQRFINYYSISDFPFLGIMDPRTGELVLKIKATDAISFCESVMNFLDSHPNFESLDMKLSSAPNCSKTKNGYSNHGHSEMTESGTWNGRKRKHKEAQGEKMEENQSGDLEGKRRKKNDEEEIHGQSDCSNQRSSQSEYMKYLNGDGPSVVFQFILPNGSRGAKQAFSLHAPVQAVIYFANDMGYNTKSFDLVLNFPARVLGKEDPNLSLEALNLNKQELVRIEGK